MSAAPEKRDSRALQPELISDPHERAEAEARNGLRQYDYGINVIQTALERGSFKLRVSLVLGLHREALAGISVFAGNFRPAGVEIQGSKHEPAGAHLVPELIEQLCDYVNDNWENTTPIHLAARYVEAKLDTPVCRRQREDSQNTFLRGSLDRRGNTVTGNSNHS